MYNKTKIFLLLPNQKNSNSHVHFYSIPTALLSVIIIIILSINTIPKIAKAGGFHISIIGARRTAMMTTLGKPDDMTALFHNPAGLADQKGQKLHLYNSVTFLKNKFELQALDENLFPEINPKGCGEEGNAACPWPIGENGYYTESISPVKTFGVLPFVGFSSDLSFIEPWMEDIVISLAAYAPNFYGGTLPDDAPTAYFMTEGFFAVISGTAGFGWRLNRYLAIGGNISYNYMRMIFGQKYSLIDIMTPVGEAPDPTTSMLISSMELGDLQMEYDGVDHGMGWNVSVLLTPFDMLSIGLGYSASTSPRFKGDLNLKALGNGADQFESVISTIGYKLPQKLEVEMPIPPSLQLGVNMVLASWLEVGIDYRLWFYNLYKKQIVKPIYIYTEEEKDKDLTEPLTEESLSKDKKYNISYEIALGFLFRPLTQIPELELMTGIAYDQSPVPDEYFSLDNPSLSQIVWSTGLRWQVNESWRLATSYMLLNYLKRDVTNSKTNPPANIKGSGLNHIPALEVEWKF